MYPTWGTFWTHKSTPGSVLSIGKVIIWTIWNLHASEHFVQNLCFQRFLIFKCIFEAFRGISGSSFAWEGICKIFWTNQISTPECRELSGTYSIWGYKIIVLLVFPFVSKPKLEPVPGNSRHCSANICFIQKILIYQKEMVLIVWIKILSWKI